MSQRRAMFSSHSIFLWTRDRRTKLRKEVESADIHFLLAQNLEEYSHKVAQSYVVSIPRVKMAPGERSGKHDSATGQWALYLPFEGSAEVFDIEPSSHPIPLPELVINSNNELVLTYSDQYAGADLERRINIDLDNIRQCLASIEQHLAGFTVESLQPIAQSAAEARIKKYKDEQDTLSRLGFTPRS